MIFHPIQITLIILSTIEQLGHHIRNCGAIYPETFTVPILFICCLETFLLRSLPPLTLAKRQLVVNPNRRLVVDIQYHTRTICELCKYMGIDKLIQISYSGWDGKEFIGDTQFPIPTARLFMIYLAWNSFCNNVVTIYVYTYHCEFS